MAGTRFRRNANFHRMTDANEPLTCLVYTRVSKATYERLQHLMTKSNEKTMTEFVRAIILKEMINMYQANIQPDALTPEFAHIRNELKVIGNNISQITREFHGADNASRKWVQAIKAEAEYKKVESKVDRLLVMMEEALSAWPQK